MQRSLRLRTLLERSELDRANYLLISQFFNLNHACRALTDAFGFNVYMVGSVLKSPKFRDVDLRVILEDEDYERMFPKVERKPHSGERHPLLALLNCSISEWLQARTGLPIDFQIQKQSEANKEYQGDRYPLGIEGIAT